jgi:hypothetical protein
MKEDEKVHKTPRQKIMIEKIAKHDPPKKI